ncbi:hypothetical protein BAUCODRAFT_342099 [Baudoinia panamericana UAMH 10762]|uniref:Uncharacterized protein n=1 Tax=Baudoinia panamericana (strain UAMH 10762) TaxID=717646 RepID=M2LY06_BAUPA|nr:uncharacterized protein BAUCODRAFT_342099 [Baudoinia panamericana UAMH 10762]EMC99577.1 hypothetical protein BAUCODRAFT_342099 [Baudoinia panamericana UAMH 10762]
MLLFLGAVLSTRQHLRLVHRLNAYRRGCWLSVRVWHLRQLVAERSALTNYNVLQPERVRYVGISQSTVKRSLDHNPTVPVNGRDGKGREEPWLVKNSNRRLHLRELDNSYF